MPPLIQGLQCCGSGRFYKDSAPTELALIGADPNDFLISTAVGHWLQPGGLADGSRGLRSAERDDTPGSEQPSSRPRRGRRTVITSFWHPSGVRDHLPSGPGVSLRSTLGYLLASRRDAPGAVSSAKMRQDSAMPSSEIHRARKRLRSNLGCLPCARSARISPMAAENLNPCPEQGLATSNG